MLCWCWRLLLEWCERKILLAGWRLLEQNRVIGVNLLKTKDESDEL